MKRKTTRDPGSIQLRRKRIDEHSSGAGDARLQDKARADQSARDSRARPAGRKTQFRSPSTA
jgi:hypothetical protein